MKTTLGLAVALVALSPPARAGSQGAVSGTATSPDRIPIRYHAAGKGDPALVFVHCGGCERGFWDGQVAHFAAKHRVVALDLAGHGQSGGGRKDWTMPAFGQDVVSVVEALDLKRVVLIGHSIGGPVVLEAARRMPGRVAGLVLVDTLVDFEQKAPAAEEMEKALSALQADYRATTTAFVSQLLFSASTPEPVKARVLETVLSVPQEIGVAVAPLQHGLRPAAGAARDQGPHPRHQLRPVSHQRGGQPQACPRLPGGHHEGSGALPHARAARGLQRAPGGGPARAGPERRTAVRLRVY